MKTEFADITGYYDESRALRDEWTCKSLGEILALEEEPATRWPVRNREPREPINSQKRAIIHERDGGRCRYCARTDERLVLDHIIPRSAFPANQLHIADRSDNLHSACWGCNEKRSNYEAIHIKRLGVVTKCWHCIHPEYDGDNEMELPYPVTVLVFCGRCGISTVPSVEGWVL